MKLLDACEPLFREVCEMQRLARQDKAPAYRDARRQVKQLLDTLHKRLESDALAGGGIAKDTSGLQVNRKVPFPADSSSGLDGQGHREPVTVAELVLAYFADDLMTKPPWPGEFAHEWQKDFLGRYYNMLAGGGHFYQLLARAQQEYPELCMLFYKCLCLGFEGMHQGNRPQVQQIAIGILKDLRTFVNVPDDKKLCAKSYKTVDSRKLAKKSWRDKMVYTLILSSVLSLGVIFLFVVAYRNSTSAIGASVATILKQAPQQSPSSR